VPILWRGGGGESLGRPPARLPGCGRGPTEHRRQDRDRPLCDLLLGPIGLKASQISRGDLVWAFSLTVILLTLNVISLPIRSSLLLERSLALRPADLLGVMVAVVLIPVLIGATYRRFRPERAVAAVSPLNLISHATLALAVITGVAANLSELGLALDSWVLVASLTVVAISGLVGWSIRAETARRRAASDLIPR